jgi:hypothetical protein
VRKRSVEICDSAGSRSPHSKIAERAHFRPEERKRVVDDAVHVALAADGRLAVVGA